MADPDAPVGLRRLSPLREFPSRRRRLDDAAPQLNTPLHNRRTIEEQPKTRSPRRPPATTRRSFRFAGGTSRDGIVIRRGGESASADGPVDMAGPPSGQIESTTTRSHDACIAGLVSPPPSSSS